MEARYALRKHPWLAACQGPPEMVAPGSPRLDALLEPFVTTCEGQAPAPHAPTSLWGLLSDVARTNIASIAARCGQSRLSLQGVLGWDAWDNAPWRQALSGHVPPHLGQGDGGWVIPRGFLRPVGSRWVWPGSGAAVWAPAPTVTGPCPWAMCPARGIPWWTRGWPCPTQGPRRRPVSTQLAFRLRGEATARVTRGPGRGWRNTGPGCRIAGGPGTRRGGAPGGGGGWRPWESARCWRGRRPRRCGLWRARPRPRAVGGGGPHVPSKTAPHGASRWVRRPAGGSTGAMGPQAHWSSRPSRDGGAPERLGASKAPRRWGGSAPALEPPRRGSPWSILCPRRGLRRRWGPVPGWPKPHIASQHASSGARAKPGWRMTRGAAWDGLAAAANALVPRHVVPGTGHPAGATNGPRRWPYPRCAQASRGAGTRPVSGDDVASAAGTSEALATP